MPRVSSTDLSNRLGQYQDEALKHPVIITKNNHERLVMLSIEEYRRLKQLDRKALFVEELASSGCCRRSSRRAARSSVTFMLGAK